VRRPGVALDETQPRAQRLRSVANWQALAAGCWKAMPARWPRVAHGVRRRPGAARRGQQSIALVGVDLDRYDRIVGLRSKVVAGGTAGPGEAIIGRELASDLGVRVGDR
jgi:lipoprotein-releasing system permease protein